MIREILVNKDHLRLECIIYTISIEDDNRIERIMRVSELLNQEWKLEKIETIITKNEQLIVYNLKK